MAETVDSRSGRGRRVLFGGVVLVALLLAGAIVLLRPDTAVGRKAELQVVNLQVLGQCAWEVRLDDKYWFPTSLPPPEWGSGPINGRLQVTDSSPPVPDLAHAVFRSGGRSVELTGPWTQPQGCTAPG